jgi:hypothetical protein
MISQDPETTTELNNAFQRSDLSVYLSQCNSLLISHILSYTSTALLSTTLNPKTQKETPSLVLLNLWLSSELLCLLFINDALPSHGVKPTWGFHKVKLRKIETRNVATLLWPSVGVKPNTWKKWGFGVLRDSRMFRAQQKGPKHLALSCSWCHWKGLEA